MTSRSTAALAVAASAVLVTAGCSSSSGGGATNGDAPGISTEATGTVTGTPDTVTVVLGVQTQAPDANTALEDNTAKASAVIGQLTGHGIADEDIQTSDLSVDAQHGPDHTVTGYQVTNQVTATVHEISKAGTLIDAAAGAAGDAIRVRNTSFSIADDSDLRAQARSEAVAQAKAQAQQIADAAGVDLGGVRSITEEPKKGGTPMPRRSLSDNAAATPVEPGSQDLTVTVSAVYDID